MSLEEALACPAVLPVLVLDTGWGLRYKVTWQIAWVFLSDLGS